MFDHIIIQFAKYPRLGKVKTRLAPDIGEQACLNLHVKLLHHTHERLKQSISELGGLLVLSLDQLGEHSLISEAAKYTPVVVQEGSDLGEKMANAIRWGLNLAKKVIVVGSDCPLLNTNYISQALESLNDEQHVFINAEDGGYVLVGATEVCDELFNGVPWGSEDVMQVTLQKLQLHNKQAAILGPLWDVDRIEDYKRLLDLFSDFQALHKN